MTKSSYGLVLLFAGWGLGAEAAPPPAGLVTADEAMRHYHETYGIQARAASGAACAPAGSGSDEDIVVCGRIPRRAYRLPLPIEREDGEIVRHINEPGSGVGAMAGAACTHSCYKPVTIDPRAVIAAAPKIFRHLLHPDDD